MNENGEALLDTHAFAKICKALGHPARIRIVEHLKAIDQCICGEIVQILHLLLPGLGNSGAIQENRGVNLNIAELVCEVNDGIKLPGRKG
ncbi:MAG: hypothetical protein HGJ94_22255 [Desulfosarcina sp.]|nr:hypothetical protein [Desulfosarcina sp.]